MPSQLEKCERLAELHTGHEPFIIPNPWDTGSARLLEGLGFQALATTSAGFAYTLGSLDGSPTLEDKLQHCEAMAAATSIPINVDFEDGYADDPAAVARNVSSLISTGIAGCSIEDFSRDQRVIFDRDHAVERIEAAARTISGSGLPVQLTARAENLLRGVIDLEDTIRRLQAYAKAGADVLYAPGIKSLDDLRTVTGELDKPFNVLVPFLTGATVAELGAHGARRISLGAALTWVSLKPILDAAKEMLEEGSFRFLAAARSGGEVQRLLSA